MTRSAHAAGWLRSLLRYLHQTGRIATDLTPHVIGPMLYAYEEVPSTLDRNQIAAVLIDWRAESLRIHHTKTNACSYMPLVTAVGEALLDYLRLGRPQVDRREVFIRSFAPYTCMKNLYGMVQGRLAAADVKPLGMVRISLVKSSVSSISR